MARSIKQCIPLLQEIVQRMPLPVWYSRDEALSIGYIALVAKLHKFDSSKSSIKTYIANVVRYAVLTEQRKLSTWFVRERSVGIFWEDGRENE